MNLHSPLLRPLLLAVSAFSLSGCVSDATNTSASGVAHSWGEVRDRVRLSLSRGAAFDDGLMAARQGDGERMAQARRTLQKLGDEPSARRLEAASPFSLAEEQVAFGVYWSTQAARANASQKAALDQKEAAAYRRALELSNGEFTSSRPDLLNALGYFLADKGSGKEDFARAEKLTRAALAQQDQALSDAKQASGEASVEVASARFTCANIRDSLAWALFKRFEIEDDWARRFELHQKAQSEQEAALKEARESVASLGAAATLPAELPYHMAMILEGASVFTSTVPSIRDPMAANRNASVQKLLREALELEPDFAPAQHALNGK